MFRAQPLGTEDCFLALRHPAAQDSAHRLGGADRLVAKADNHEVS